MHELTTEEKQAVMDAPPPRDLTPLKYARANFSGYLMCVDCAHYPRFAPEDRHHVNCIIRHEYGRVVDEAKFGEPDDKYDQALLRTVQETLGTDAERRQDRLMARQGGIGRFSFGGWSLRALAERFSLGAWFERILPFA